MGEAAAGRPHMKDGRVGLDGLPRFHDQDRKYAAKVRPADGAASIRVGGRVNTRHCDTHKFIIVAMWQSHL